MIMDSYRDGKQNEPEIFKMLFQEEEENEGEGQTAGLDEILQAISAQAEAKDTSLPDELPILPLRGVVVYPQTAVPLTIGQPRSIRLVDDVASGQRLIGLLTSKDADNENPGPDQLYRIGTVAMIHRLFRAPDGTIRLLVQGLSRFRVVEFTETEPYLKAKVEPAPEIEEEGLEVDALARNIREQFIHIADLMPSIPRELAASIAAVEDPLQTAYTIANFQRMELDEAQGLLETDSVSRKVTQAGWYLTARE
jgi:ATP-dependent Lon protease